MRILNFNFIFKPSERGSVITWQAHTYPDYLYFSSDSLISISYFTKASSENSFGIFLFQNATLKKWIMWWKWPKYMLMKRTLMIQNIFLNHKGVIWNWNGNCSSQGQNMWQFPSFLMLTKNIYKNIHDFI